MRPAIYVWSRHLLEMSVASQSVPSDSNSRSIHSKSMENNNNNYGGKSGDGSLVQRPDISQYLALILSLASIHYFLLLFVFTF